MKKWISGLMIFVLLCSVMVMPIQATEKEVMLKRNMDNFFEEGLGESLVKRTDFYYMDFVEELRTNPKLNVYMTALDIIYNDLESELGEPTKEKYTEALINIMKTYESDNAEDIAEQHKLEHQKSDGSYIYDAVKIGASLLGMSEAANALKPEIESVVEQIFDGIDKMNEYNERLSDFETLLENYFSHDRLLEIIQKNATGNLKDAATALRSDLKAAMKIILESTVSSLKRDGVKQITNKLLDDSVWNLLKNDDSYKNNHFVQSFLKKTASSVSVGLDLGKFSGNVFIKGEDGLNCFLELKADYDISIILEEVLKYYEKNYDELFQKDGQTMVENYVGYGNYLISCRIRGEYLFYSMFVDCGILDIFYHRSEVEAEKQFLEMTERLKFLKEHLDGLLKTKIIEISDYFYKRDELVGMMVMEIDEEHHNLSAESEAFVKDELFLEWLDDSFSITNNGCNYVKLFGMMLGDDFVTTEKSLLKEGWVNFWQYENVHQHCTFIDAQPYLLELAVDDNGKICGWYINNWPEGDFVWQYLDEIEREQSQFAEEDLYGIWTIDLDKFTESELENFNYEFRAGYEYGWEMTFSENGDFSYYIGIGIGGKGTYYLEDNKIFVSLTTYEEGEQLEINFPLITEGGKQYIVKEDNNYIIYWSKK